MGNLLVLKIEQVAFAILFEDSAKDPAMTVIIGELRILQFRIQLGNFFEEIEVAPLSARGSGFRILLQRSTRFLFGWILLFLGIHEFAVGFLVPPGVAKKRIHEEVALVHVAIHALAARDGAGELVFDGMTSFFFGNGSVTGETQSLMSIFAPPIRIAGRTVICINDVAGRATAGTVISWMIVRPHKPKQRIV